MDALQVWAAGFVLHSVHGLLAKRLCGCCRRVRNLINNAALTSNTGDSVNQAGLTVVKFLV